MKWIGTNSQKERERKEWINAAFWHPCTIPHNQVLVMGLCSLLLSSFDTYLGYSSYMYAMYVLCKLIHSVLIGYFLTGNLSWGDLIISSVLSPWCECKVAPDSPWTLCSILWNDLNLWGMGKYINLYNIIVCFKIGQDELHHTCVFANT